MNDGIFQDKKEMIPMSESLPADEKKRMTKEIDADFDYLAKLNTSYYEFTEEEFTEFLPLYQNDTIKEIQQDYNKRFFYTDLSNKLISKVGMYKPFIVNFKENDGSTSKILFPQLFASNSAISSEDMVIMDVFTHLKAYNHPLHRDKADADLITAVMESQDFKRLADQRIITEMVSKALGMKIAIERNKVHGIIDSNSTSTNSEKEVVNVDSIIDFDS